MLWLWLLPIVIGWLQISPKCDSTRLRSAVERANRLARVATDDGRVVLVREAQTEARAIELTLTEVDELRRDEKCTAPVFNYARFFPWVQAVEDVSEAFQAASEHCYNHHSVDPSIKWVPVESGQKPDERNRVGTRTQVENYCIPWEPADSSPLQPVDSTPLQPADSIPLQPADYIPLQPAESTPW